MPHPAVRVPRQDAEAVRRRLMELGALRIDLEVARDGEDVLFPVAESCGPTLPTELWEFAGREVRVGSYQELLPPGLREEAPRAFETLGDIAIVKVPPPMEGSRAEVGEALRRFTGARAVFHDRGVRDPFRTRDLERIAGDGGSLTLVRENGAELWVDPARAYYSPRLASERARVAQQARPGEVVVDLFGGVAPFGVQLAKRGADVHTVDLNPAATDLARRNATHNRVALHVHTGNARGIAGLPRADRVIMNLPHGAHGFLDVAASLLRPHATLHYHEILPPERAWARARELEHALAELAWPCRERAHRTVRNYSPQEEHLVFDLEGLG